MSIPPPGYPHPGPPPFPPELPEGAGPPVEPGWQAPWPLWTAPVGLITAFAAALVGAVLLGAVAAIAGVDVGDEPPGVLIGATVVQDLALIATAIWFAGRVRRVRAADFGLRPVALGTALRFTGLAWLTFILATYVWSIALGLDEPDNLPDELGADESTAALVAVLLLVTVLAPIAEEFFFRGFFFTALRSWRGPWIAAAITGIVFGAIHLGSSEIEFIVPLMAFGFVLCMLYWRTGSLLPPIALHALNNGLAFGVSEKWSALAVIGLMAGATAVVLILVAPFVRRSPAAAAP